MKKLNGEQIFSLMSDIDPKLLAEAVPPSWVSDTGAVPRKPKRHPFAWLDSGWAAAVLSAVVAIGVLVAIVMAGRMGTGDPVGGTSAESESVTETESATIDPEQKPEYSLIYTPLGNGTCRAELIPADNASTLYSVTVPEKSPMGDTVVDLVVDINAHAPIPALLTAEDFERYIQAPLEAYYGLTVEEAEAIAMDTAHPKYEAGFKLRRYLAFYARKSMTELESIAELEAMGEPPMVDTDYYLLEQTLDAEERLQMYSLMVSIRFTAEKWEIANRNLVAHGADPALYPADIRLSAFIRTLTLPATLRSFPVDMFDEWIDLEKIIYEGTVDDWTTLTGGAWERIPVACSNGEFDGKEWMRVNKTTVLIANDDQASYISGYAHWEDQLWNGGIVSGDLVYPELSELAAGHLFNFDIPEGGALPTVTHEMREGWTYTLSVTVYNNDLAEVARGSFDTLSTLPTGEYYVELTVHALGPYLEEVDGHEGYGVCFTFHIVVFDDHGSNGNDGNNNPDTPGDVISVPLSSAYTGEMSTFDEFYDRYPLWEGTQFRWRIEKRQYNGLLVEELACPNETFTLSGGDDFYPPFEVMRETGYHYYVHITVFENGEWRSVSYCVLELAIED